VTVWRPIETEIEYNVALDRIDELIDVPRSDHVMNELMLISIFVERYEDEVHPIPSASSLEIISFMMEMKGIRQKDLIPILGSKGQVSRILNGTRRLTSDKIVALSAFLGIPATVLLPDEKAMTKKHVA